MAPEPANSLGEVMDRTDHGETTSRPTVEAELMILILTRQHGNAKFGGL